MKRRTFLASLAPILGAPALIGLMRKSPPKIAGGFVDDAGGLGHRLRDGSLRAATGPVQKVRVAIIGGGMAGLSAAWELNRKRMSDFVVLELEQQSGGNARSGENEISAYPWAAHYVPVPDRRATLVRELFTELGVLKGGVWEERYLCFTPQERLFRFGEWHDGITPEYALDEKERDAFKHFDEAIAAQRATGQYTIPMARGAPAESPLDNISMARWLADRGLTTPALKWYVDYACRDDYGADARDISAWAGIHYFASRAHEETGPLTWPDGNGWIAKRLAQKSEAQLRIGEPAVRARRSGNRWHVATTKAVYEADAVIFAAPSFVAPRVVRELARHPVPLTYSPWLTANLVIERRPAERGRPLAQAWDNVIYDSPALGYVVATHQSLRSREDRSVWTYYWPMSSLTPKQGRELLLRRTWSEWTNLILADLAKAHPDIRDCVSRIDIMRMGHAMVRPAVGSLRAAQQVPVTKLPGFYFANSDLSTLSLFEEAQYRGVTAARGALDLLSRSG